MTTTPRITVLLTVYNRTRYVLDALDSVLAQTFSELEVIIADDSGSQLLANLVRSRVDQSRVRYIANPMTLGVVASLRNAAQLSRGEYIAVLNDDDQWDPRLLSRLIAPLDANPTLVLAFSDYWVVDESGNIDSQQSNYWSAACGRSGLNGGTLEDSAIHAVMHRVPFNLASVCRKHAIDWSLVDERVGGAYDFWIPCLIAAQRQPFFYVSDRLAYYRLHGGMETNAHRPHKGEDAIYIYNSLLQRGWFPELRHQLLTDLGYSLFLVARNKQRHCRHAEARHYLWRCMQIYNPRLQVRALLSLARTFLPRVRSSPADRSRC